MTPESTAVVVRPDVVDIGGGGIYVVQVNEGAIEASQMGCDWWYIRRPAFVASGTLRDVKPAGLIAGVIEIGPYDRQDAEFMANHMVESGGIPRSAVRVIRAAVSIE